MYYNTIYEDLDSRLYENKIKTLISPHGYHIQDV